MPKTSVFVKDLVEGSFWNTVWGPAEILSVDLVKPARSYMNATRYWTIKLEDETIKKRVIKKEFISPAIKKVDASVSQNTQALNETVKVLQEFLNKQHTGWKVLPLDDKNPEVFQVKVPSALFLKVRNKIVISESLNKILKDFSGYEEDTDSI